MSAAPSPRPRPKPGTATAATAPVADKPAARKRGRDRIVQFLGRTWDRDATHPQVGWELAHECLATPDMLERLRKEHAAQPDPQIELNAYLEAGEQA